MRLKEFTRKQIYDTYRIITWNYDKNGPTTIRSIVKFNPGENLDFVKNTVRDANFKYVTIERHFPTAGWKYVDGVKIDNTPPRLSEGKFSLYEYDMGKISKLQHKLNNVMISDRSLPPESRDDVNGILNLAKILDNQYNIKSGEMIYWILSRYVDSEQNWEDIPSRIIPGLVKFQKLKNKKLIPVEIRDINKIKTLEEFEDIIDEYDDTVITSNKEDEKRIETQFYNTGDAELLYDDNDIKVVSPKTEAASCFFGRNTRWCTAAKNDNMFNRYHENGPLYIVLLKKENKRYQFFWGNNEYDQFMDALDREINPNDLADKYPILWKIFGPIAKKNESIFLDLNPSKTAQLDAVTTDLNNVYNIKNLDYDVLIDVIKYMPEAVTLYKDQNDERFQIDAFDANSQSYQWLDKPTREVTRLYKQNLYGTSEYEY